MVAPAFSDGRRGTTSGKVADHAIDAVGGDRVRVGAGPFDGVLVARPSTGRGVIAGVTEVVLPRRHDVRVATTRG